MCNFSYFLLKDKCPFGIEFNNALLCKFLKCIEVEFVKGKGMLKKIENNLGRYFLDARVYFHGK
jgi:hypothetical protein